MAPVKYISSHRLQFIFLLSRKVSKLCEGVQSRDDVAHVSLDGQRASDMKLDYHCQIKRLKIPGQRFILLSFFQSAESEVANFAEILRGPTSTSSLQRYQYPSISRSKDSHFLKSVAMSTFGVLEFLPGRIQSTAPAIHAQRYLLPRSLAPAMSVPSDARHTPSRPLVTAANFKQLVDSYLATLEF